MNCAFRSQREDSNRFVGDPVDVVTGALLDATYDFRIEAPFPFEFVRHYNSHQHRENRGLGWGHRHDFDHELFFTYDNTVGYESPDGTEISFSFPASDGSRTARLGRQLERVRVDLYRVHLPDERVLEFHFPRSDWPARLTAVHHSGGSIQLYYDDARGLLIGFSDSLGHSIRIDWASIPDPGTGAPRMHMAAFTLLASSSYPEELILGYRYDAYGHLLSGTDRYRNTFAFEYDAQSRMSKLVDRRGYAFHYTYDSRGRCISSGAQDGVEAVQLEYLDGATVVTLADGGQWLYEHPEGYLSRVVDPYGGEHTREVNDDGQLVSEIDAAGREFVVVRDGSGKALGRRDSVGQLWPLDEAPEEPEHYVAQTAQEWEYGALVPIEHGLPIRRYLELNRLPTDVIDALVPPATGSMAIDFAERWSETTVHDLQGLRLRVERLDGTRRSWSYDASANRTRFTDFDGSTYRFTFVSWNRTHSFTNPIGLTTELTHARRLELQRVVDPSGLVVDFGYDLKNRLASVSRDGAVHETYEYDGSDELVRKRDAHGRVLLSFEREDEGRLETMYMASGERHDLMYADDRRLASATVTNVDGTKDEYRFAHDAWGQRTLDERNGVGVHCQFSGTELDEMQVLGEFITNYQRIDKTSLEVNDPTGKKHVVQLCHGGVVRRRMSNGMTEVSQYHPSGDCLTKVVYAGQGPRWIRRYERAGEGDVHSISDNVRGDHRFFYDAAHRLVGERLPNGTKHVFSYSHGDTLLEGPGLSGVTVTHQRVFTANGSRLEYDHRDNLCARHTPTGTFRLTYDSDDQLTSIDESSFGRWSARYDVEGRRIETTFNGRKTVFYWETDRLAAEVLPDGRLRVYVYVDDLALVPIMFVDYENIDADPESGARYFVFANHLGAPEVIQDDTGHVVWRARYEAYGTAHVEVGADFHQPLRWPGHYFDVATGLHYVRFRYYSPELGMFLQSDPEGLGGGHNLHGYGNANPVRFVDVQGLSTGSGGASNGCPATTPPPKKKKKKTKKQKQQLKELEVDSYRNQQKKDAKTPGLERDHMPSGAAVKARMNRQLEKSRGYPMTPTEEKRLEKNLSTMAMKEKTHEAGRTHGHKNTKKQVTKDSRNLRAAAKKDMAAAKKNLTKDGNKPKDVDASLKKMHKRNEEIGVYNKTLPEDLIKNPPRTPRTP